MFHPLKTTGIAGLLLAASLAHAAAQDDPWLDPKLLDAAKAEGGEMTIYSDTNEGEGLPLFKLFEAATGIKTNYVRGADPPLMARMVVEFRGNQKAWDVAQLGTMDTIPAQLLLPFDPSEAKNIRPRRATRTGAWYGLYANYNAPAYNTQHVQSADLPKSTPISRSTRTGPAMSPSTAPTVNGCGRCSSTSARTKRRP